MPNMWNSKQQNSLPKFIAEIISNNDIDILGFFKTIFSGTNTRCKIQLPLDHSKNLKNPEKFYGLGGSQEAQSSYVPLYQSMPWTYYHS